MRAFSQKGKRIVDCKADRKTQRCRFVLVLAQRAVKSRENEISAAVALLHPALITNRILSADAMHTKKEQVYTLKILQILSRVIFSH
ncbi:hypothetical protein Krac_7060 [Ktedonobacter racemifer DSM 44963]|uniref:Transposase IS4 family protein n=1 Tax=Ktedonobacter racemifer DSM 44963 TaxID=485913 RepID=D6TQU5_KTERA|nr:hypothetical protein Krac_7060 [Ktedonobacter racemifer DSM 44963]